MKSGEEFLKNLLNRLLPNRAAPVLARVLRVHEGPGKNKYSVDVQVLKAGTLEETDQIISEVPINPIWADKENKGLYAPPPEGGVVIVGFLEWNVAYPYIEGFYSNEYNAQKFEKRKFILTDGKDLRFEFSDDEVLLHDSNKFEMRFVKGLFNLINDKGLKLEIDSNKQTYLFENGNGNSIFVSDDGILMESGCGSMFEMSDNVITLDNAGGSVISMSNSGISVNGSRITLN